MPIHDDGEHGSPAGVGPDADDGGTGDGSPYSTLATASTTPRQVLLVSQAGEEP